MSIPNAKNYLEKHRGRLKRGAVIPWTGYMEMKKVPKPKRSRTMRSISKINGVKVFSFPDHVWKVRDPRKRKRK